MEVFMSGMLSKGTRFALSTEGQVGSRELTQLLNLLNLQLEWAIDDEKSEAEANNSATDRPKNGDEGA